MKKNYFEKQFELRYFEMNDFAPAISNRLSMNRKNELFAGFMYYSPKGEKSLFASDSADLIDEGKYERIAKDVLLRIIRTHGELIRMESEGKIQK